MEYVTTTQEAFHFLEQLKCSDVYTPERRKTNLVGTQKLLLRGEKFEKIVRDVEMMLHPGYFIDGAPELKRFRRLYKETRQKYFPETKTRRQKINDLIEAVYKLNIHPRADTVDVINMLIELRDEEEDE